MAKGVCALHKFCGSVFLSLLLLSVATGLRAAYGAAIIPDGASEQPVQNPSHDPSVDSRALRGCAHCTAARLRAGEKGLLGSGRGKEFSLADSLRGSLRPERTCFDVLFYHLDLLVDPESRRIEGSNRVVYRIVELSDRIQLDLFANLDIREIVDGEGRKLNFERIENAVFIDLQDRGIVGNTAEMTVYYSGEPTVAANAPWDGGFSWKKDKEGKHWVGVSCQGVGASIWWPNKDHLSDEPDSMLISVRVPEDLMLVSNGNLRGTQPGPEGYVQYDWFVSYPINNYNATINIGDYVHFSDTFHSSVGALPLDYYVLKPNEDKARKHFEQVKPMLACYEEYFAPFPFFNDGFAMVETPYLGMEHQSAIAYGNQYKTGYAGYDYSRIGLDFDYIIIHEAAHEWWGNSISVADIADLWVQEGFCTYSEALYVECMFDYETALRYINAKKPQIENDMPLIGEYGVNEEGSGDIYHKGSLLLNTLRHMSFDHHGSHDQWFEVIRGLTEDFERSTVSSAIIEDYVARKLDLDLKAFWNQYLRSSKPPVLEHRFSRSGQNTLLEYRWKADVEDFAMPIRLIVEENSEAGSEKLLRPNSNWQVLDLGSIGKGDVRFDQERYYYNISAK